MPKFSQSHWAVWILAVVVAAVPVQTVGQAVDGTVGVQKPIKYGILVDSSGSMRSMLESVVELTKNLVDENRPGDETFLVRFVSSDKIKLLADMTDSKDDLKDAAEQIYIEGGQTAILDAVNFATNYLDTRAADPSIAKVLVLITDGDDRDSRARIGEVAELLKRSNIRCFAIGMSDLKVGTKTLDILAKGTGGRVFLPKGSAERRESAKLLAAAMRGN